MKTIDNLNITSITFREYRDLYGSGKEYSKRLNIILNRDLYEGLNDFSNEIGVDSTEVIRQTISSLITSYKDLIDENYY